jgi:ATP-dependent DNA helicase RecG
MTNEKLKQVLSIGETVAVEFKRCGGNSISMDTYETVCSFLNRYGGDIFLGVEDNGVVRGVLEKSASDMVKNFISMMGNPDIISPTIHLSPDIIDYDGMKVIHIHIPPSSEVHSYKKVIYDRVGDSDVKVTATGQIAQMYIRKHEIFTERKVYPFVTDEHLRLDMLPRIRQMALNRDNRHPWKNMSDKELLQSATLISEDAETGKVGYNLAAIMLLGRDDVIFSTSPTYRTDALLRKVNVDRYDDRLLVQTNLIDSYDLLMGFAEKHLWDKFYLENDVRVSLRNNIAREMLVNTLMHREFTSTYFAKFVIEKDRMYVENANRATTGDVITPENLAPDSKNPIIAAFFRNIGFADELGSGVRNLYHYGKRYSGQPPQLIDGDIFRIIVPLDNEYSFDANTKGNLNGLHTNNCAVNCDVNCDVNENQRKILEIMVDNSNITMQGLADAIGVTKRTVDYAIKKLKDAGIVSREGADKKGIWVVKSTEDGL